MPLVEDVARTIVRRRRGELEQLNPEERLTVVNSIIEKLSAKSEPELIRFLSAREPGVTPELETELTQARRTKEIVEAAPPGERFGPGAVRAPDISGIEREAELQRMGVVTGEPLPAGDVELGFAADPVEALKRVLSEQKGQDVTVFESGDDILFIDPETQEVKRAEPDWRGKLGRGLPIIGDIIGTVGGGFAGAAVTKQPAGIVAGETVGAGVGATVGEFIRLAVGKGLGVHDLSFEAMTERATGEGKTAAAVTAGVGGFVVASKGVKNFIKGRIFTPDEAIKHGFSTEEADVIMREVNRILGKEGEVKGTLFKRTGDVEIGAKEAKVSQRIEDVRKFTEREAADTAALAKAAEIVTEPSAVRGGAGVQKVFAERAGRRLTQASGVVARNVKELDQQLKSISQTPKEAVGEPTRAILIEKAATVKKAVDAAWDVVRKTGGFANKTGAFGIKIPVGKGVRALRRIEARQQKTATTTAGKSPLFGRKGKPADLEDFNVEISALKADIRAAKKNKQFGSPQVRELQNAVTAMERDRKLALIKADREDLIKAIEAAEVKTAKFHATFNRSIVGDLTAKNEKGVFKIKSKEFVDRMLKGDRTEANQLLDVIGDQPTLMAHWKEGIADAYKRKAFPDGRFSRRQSRQFLETNKDVLGTFFTPNELAQIRKAGDMAQVVKKQVAQMDALLKRANKQWGSGKLKSLDPDNVLKFITNDAGGFVRPSGEPVQVSINKINFIKRSMKRHPGVWGNLQKEYSTSLHDRIIDTQSGRILPKKIADMVVNDKKQIKAIMGDEYYKNLVSVNKAVQIINRKPKALIEMTEAIGAIKQGMRIFAAPLTPRGRAFTAVDLFRTKAGHDAVAKALLDPSSMTEVAKLAEHGRITREVAELAASIGFLTE